MLGGAERSVAIHVKLASSSPIHISFELAATLGIYSRHLRRWPGLATVALASCLAKRHMVAVMPLGNGQGPIKEFVNDRHRRAMG